MRKLISIAAILATATLVGCTDDGAGPIDPTTDPLSAAERTALTFTREEEKLARDVYAALADNGQPFVNIGASEQQHMDAIATLLVRYQLPDPAATTGPGEFVDPTLQGLYGDLTAAGQPGAVDAYAVGCLIEELDLRDLALARLDVTHADVDATYANLALGSRNHLRAFHGKLVAAGGSYVPQYLDQATFDAILAGAHEQP
ncbi:MAG: DUF2202 domain-containing protein [Myxococcales bacterium]|nr:DUF2202 domain-containing protein [Myxococcales bacterium]